MYIKSSAWTVSGMVHGDSWLKKLETLDIVCPRLIQTLQMSTLRRHCVYGQAFSSLRISDLTRWY